MDMDLSMSMQLVVPMAVAEADFCHNAKIEPEHLFAAISKLPDVAMMPSLPHDVRREIEWLHGLFKTAELSRTTVRRRLRTLLRKAVPLEGTFSGHRSERCHEVFRAAEEFAREENSQTIDVRHFVIVLICQGGELLQAAVADIEGRWSLLRRGVGLSGSADELSSAQAAEGAGAAAPMRPQAAHPGRKPRDKSTTPFLDKFGRDVTALAKDGKLTPCVGRRDEMRQVAQILRRRTKNNPVLVGDPGVGKTCIVEGLAQRVTEEAAPQDLSKWRIVEVSVGSLLAGAKYRGEFEERLQNLIREAKSDPSLIIFIDELHTMVGAGGASGKGMDAAQILKPALARGDIKVIGATTIAEYRKYVESDAALERRFQMVWVNEPSKQEAIEILATLKATFEGHHHLKITDEAVTKAVEFSMRFLPDHRLPDKAIDLIDQACAARMLATLSFSSERRQAKAGPLDVEDVAKVVAERTKIPVGMLTADERLRLREMETTLKQRVMGQDHAVRDVANVVRTARLGMADPRRPAGVFLFLGPTGTGKTELAKGLAEFLFGTEDALIHFDMSEYKEKHEVAKLIGAPPGYIGHDEEGQLISKVRTRPYSVVLFDEVEKAHPEVYDLLLQVFDEGRLTDAKGRQARFSECIIIMTSNLGSRSRSGAEAGTAFGFHPRRTPTSKMDKATDSAAVDNAEYIEAVLSDVDRFFRPEFLARVHNRIVFHDLSRDVLRAILGKFVAGLNARLSDKGIVVRLSPEAEAGLLDESRVTALGARGLERIFEKQISGPLAAELLEDRVHEGQHVLVNHTEAGYTFGTTSKPA
jgi:ATP-dependent Clp protease ATP-binding subunit ClpC